MTTLRRAINTMEKKEKELTTYLQLNNLERFKDNGLCKAYVKPKDVRSKCFWLYNDYCYRYFKSAIIIEQIIHKLKVIAYVSLEFVM
jgi:hypothetical protein